MPPRQARPPSTESLLPPILNLLQPPSPNPYSAHQKALTTTARLAASGHHSIAIEICFAVSRELLKLGESGSGVEIGVKMIGYMSDSDVRVDDKSRANVTQLLALTPSAGAWRKKLADSAVKWSSTHGDCPTGDPNLHQYLGEMYYKDRLFAPAEQHLLNSGKRDAASLLAELMFEWSDKGALDPGPYAARGVLPFLDQKPPNILAAGAFLTRFLSLLQTSAPSRNIFHSTLPSQDSALIEIQVTSSSTLNFLQLALITAQRAPAVGASAVQSRGMDGGIAREWESFCGRYSKSSGTKGVIGQREVQEVLGHIATEVFLVPQRGGQGGGDLLQNLMGSLFGGGGAQPGAGRGAIGGR